MVEKIKFLRVIFSDKEKPDKFKPPAKAGEWAVAGACIFSRLDPDPKYSTKNIISAWLGTDTFGLARMVEVADITHNDYQRLINRLAHFLVEKGYEKDLDKAFEIATDEAEHTNSLADRELGTVMVVDRIIGESGNVSETYKTVPRE